MVVFGGGGLGGGVGRRDFVMGFGIFREVFVEDDGLFVFVEGRFLTLI